MLARAARQIAKRAYSTAVESADAVVIGAGVVGLAVARKLAKEGRSVIVLEKNDCIGAETSSRNSEVIHAGIYYQYGSLKTNLCVKGNKQLVEFCKTRGVEYKIVGKLIVATEYSDLHMLRHIQDTVGTKGVFDIEWIHGTEAARLEPQLYCCAALMSPSTGIVDSHGLMLAYQAEMEDRGGTLVLNAPVVGGQVGSDDSIYLDVGGKDPMTLKCQWVVNSAGLYAQKVARSLKGLSPASVPAQYLCKGNYFSLVNCKPPYKRLIYPIPTDAGLGVHTTVDLGGQCKFGPDTEWVDEINYDVDATRMNMFQTALRKYWPVMPDNCLQPAYSGIRPKVQRGGQNVDFKVSTSAQHGVRGLVNLYGIESPGLTASLPLADFVYGVLSGDDRALGRQVAKESKEAERKAEKEKKAAKKMRAKARKTAEGKSAKGGALEE